MNTTLITPLTANAKLGPSVATTYRPVGDAAKGEGTCPSSCPFLPSNGGKCYTRKFLVNRQQRASRERNDSLDRLLLKNAQFVRLHTSGDFYISDADGGYVLDSEYVQEIIDWCEANPTITVWTYTHDIRAMIDAGYSYAKNSFPKNLHIVASVDTPIDATLAKTNGFRTARVIAEKSDKNDGETLCPYDLALSKGVKPTVTCSECKLCFNPKHKKDIAFIQH